MTFQGHPYTQGWSGTLTGPAQASAGKQPCLSPFPPITLWRTDTFFLNSRDLTPLLLFFYLQKPLSVAPAPDTDLSVIPDDPDLALPTATSLLPCLSHPALGQLTPTFMPKNALAPECLLSG